MLKISKKVKILFVLFIILFALNTVVFATDINMNLPSDDSLVTYENGTDTNNIDNNASNEISNTDTNSNSITDASQIQDDVGGTAAPSGVSSIAQENMSFSNILNILLIIVTLLILLGAYYLIQIRVFNNDYANIFRIYIF